MAASLVLTIAANREIRLVRERGQQSDEPLRRRIAHLLQIAPPEGCPALRRPGLGERPRDELRTWCQIGKPNVEVVAAREIFFTNSARRPANGADAQSFASQAWCSESHNAYSHALVIRPFHVPCKARDESRFGLLQTTLLVPGDRRLHVLFHTPAELVHHTDCSA